MLIVDAQIHLWHQGIPTNAAHRQISSYSAEDCLKEMDAAGVNAALIHPPGWDPGSVAMAFKAVRDYPGRFAILGSIPLAQPAEPGVLDGGRSQPGMLGLRWTFLDQKNRAALEDGSLEWLWSGAEQAGVPIALLATDSLRQVGQIAERHPGLKLTIDHLGGRARHERGVPQLLLQRLDLLLRLGGVAQETALFGDDVDEALERHQELEIAADHGAPNATHCRMIATDASGNLAPGGIFNSS